VELQELLAMLAPPLVTTYIWQMIVICPTCIFSHRLLSAAPSDADDYISTSATTDTMASAAPDGGTALATGVVVATATDAR
jgi:hypothetical protein